MMRNGGVQIYFRAILVFAWKDGAQTAAQEAAERSERVRAQQQGAAEEQERLAAKDSAEADLPDYGGAAVGLGCAKATGPLEWHPTDKEAAAGGTQETSVHSFTKSRRS